jgi:hypothetical protein
MAGNNGAGGSGTQRFFDNNALGINGWTIDNNPGGQSNIGEAKRMNFSNLRKTKSMAPDPKEELKDLENMNPDGLIPAGEHPTPNQLNLMYGFLNEFQEFAWDPENSSREVTFSPDCRHLFLCESNYYFRTVVGNRPFMDGVHYWEIIADHRTEHELKIGVTT